MLLSNDLVGLSDCTCKQRKQRTLRISLDFYVWLDNWSFRLKPVYANSTACLMQKLSKQQLTKENAV